MRTSQSKVHSLSYNVPSLYNKTPQSHGQSQSISRKLDEKKFKVQSNFNHTSNTYYSYLILCFTQSLIQVYVPFPHPPDVSQLVQNNLQPEPHKQTPGL